MNLVGKLLIAPPKIVNNFWSKTAVLVTEHTAAGSIGFIVNKRSRLGLREFFNQCDVDTDLEGHVHVGGPVNVSSITLLHSSEWTSRNTVQITDDLSLSSTTDLMHRLAMGDCPQYWKLLVGLCVWNADQLESEIMGKYPYTHEFSWLTATSSLYTLFELDQEEQWDAAIEQSGKEFAQTVLV